MLGVRRHTRFLVVPAALAAAAVALSCGGGPERESVTGPASVAGAPASDGGGSVTASKSDKRSLCHYDAVLDTHTTLSLTPQGAQAHLKAHAEDYEGACLPPCPCFDAEQLALSCPTGELQTGLCGTPAYTFGTSCDGTGGSLLGVWQVIPESRYCSAWTYSENYEEITKYDLTDTEIAACKQLIVTSPYYPKDGSCPP